MFKRTVSTVAFAQATKAYYAYPQEEYNLKAIEFEKIFEHALPQKSDDPAVAFGRSAGDSDLVEEALSTGPSQTHNVVNSVIDSFGRLVQLPTESFVQVPVPSIPFCTSFECKDDAVAKPPTDTTGTANWGKIDSDWGVIHSSDQPYTGERNGGKPVGHATLMQRYARSIPNCNSFECKNGMVSGGPDNKNEAVPENWGKQNVHWGVDDEPAIYGTHAQRSNPACTSFGCKTESYSPNTLENQSFYPNSAYVRDTHAQMNDQWLSQHRSIPSCTSFECKQDSMYKPDTKGVWTPENWGKQNQHYGIVDEPAIYGTSLAHLNRRSIPACSSAGCMTNDHQFNNQGKATPDNNGEAVPANWGKQHEHWGVDVDPAIYGTRAQRLLQMRSVPAQNSLGKKTDSMAYPPDYAGTESNWGNSNEHWQADAQPSVGEKNLIQLDLESIPTCTSFECKTGTAAQPFEKPDGHKVDYSVPNFGTDKEMVSDAGNLAEAEKSLGKWDYKDAAVAWKLNYRVPNFGMDADIADSLESEKQTSNSLDHKWEPKQDENGVWTVPQPFDNRSYSYSS